MSSDPKNEDPEYVYLTPEEINKFLENADNDLVKIKEYLSDHFHGTINLSDEMFSLFCELFSTNITLKKYLSRTFIIPENKREKKMAFKVGQQHIIILGKTLLFLKELKIQLANSNFSMENQ